ncbi:FAD-binding and (Fe-S)-binding domain-containing protein [Actinacidiphila polyblastidii]|uniref:FAD-binding and (Fe-S)-binding domain-containing protein n=1 Tax=Actinacidiphila polyblastidii TaxID=3110430 RepID=UPI0039BC375B
MSRPASRTPASRTPATPASADPAPAAPAPDGSAPDGSGPDGLVALLRSCVADPARVSVEPPRRAALAHDASPYLLTPQAVVRAASAREVAALMAGARQAGVPLTLRSGGTSLSGQAGGDGVLVDVRTHWREAEVLDDGLRIRLQPGLTIRQANARLARYGRRLGPDPASESACTVGGMVANNSSGMNCGTRDNAYRTLESLQFVLPSGTVVDSAARDADDRLRDREPLLHAGLLRLRDRVRASPQARATVERLFAMKNTMGYGLNSFLDHSSPVDTLAHLMVGSEGTLGFVGEAVFRTVPVLAHAATGLLILPGLAEATDALPALLAAGARTAELLDAASLRVAQAAPDASPALRGLRVEGHAALLVEFAEDRAEELEQLLAAARPVLDALPAVTGTALTRDAAERAAMWHARKGLYTAVAGARPAGTTALLEDVAVPMERLTGTCEGLTRLFDRHGYQDAVIFGHARDGNLHFMLTQRFDGPAEIDRYARFTDDMVDLVLREGGTLKAEHGTGRAMAPFVRRQYGDELYEVMRELKALCDPANVLNPGVLLDDDPTVHLRRLKDVPAVDPAVDRCVECGYCEPVCPTADVTTTPRQRIALRREIALAAAAGDEERRRALEEDYTYAAVDSCAADSLCVTACPVTIDTGAVMKRLRGERHGALAQAAGSATARHWGGAVTGVRIGLGAAHAAPAPVVRAATSAARRLGAGELVPDWAAGVPRPGGPRPAARRTPEARAVFFAACIGSVFTGERTEPRAGARPAGAAAAFLHLCDRAGDRARGPVRAVLRHALAVQGLRRGPPRDGVPDAGGPVAGDRPRAASGGLRRLLLHARAGAARAGAARAGPGAVRGAAVHRQRHLHPRARAAGAARAARSAPGALPRAAPDVLDRAPGDHRRPPRARRGGRRRGDGAGRVGVLRLRGRPRAAAPGGHRGGDLRAGRGGQPRLLRRLRLLQPHL